MSGFPRAFTVSQQRRRHKQRYAAKQPGRQELSDHRLGRGHGQGQELLDGPGLAFLGPHPHGHGRDQQQIKPWQECKEGFEAGLIAIEESADIKSKRAGQGHENRDEDKSGRRREIGGEFTSGDDANLSHGDTRSNEKGARNFAPWERNSHAAREDSVSAALPVVIMRNASSSVPPSR